MGLLVGGILLLVSFMLVVMLTPLVLFLRYERRWEMAGKTLEGWYDPPKL